MIASSFISQEIPIIKLDDTCQQVLRWMDEYRVMHMPVFNGAEYLGLLSEADLLEEADEKCQISQLTSKLLKAAIEGSRPIYDVIKLMDDFKLSLVPVLDEQAHLIGMITYKEVISAMVSAFNLNSEGAVFVLEMNYVDYALSEISRIVESNDARVLSAHIEFHPLDNGLIDVTIKINIDSLSGILQTLDRYDYTVKASFQNGDYIQDDSDGYDALMRYLNV